MRTYDFILAVYYGPAAVSRVDGRVYLNGQQLSGGLRVLLHLNARDHPAADGDTVAPYREADHRHVFLQIRNFSERQTMHTYFYKLHLRIA